MNDLKELPEKWVIKITEENRETIKSWFEKNDCGCFYFTVGVYYPNPKFIPIGMGYIIAEGFTEITFEQFKKWVFK